jgi:hypothetical protein
MIDAMLRFDMAILHPDHAIRFTAVNGAIMPAGWLRVVGLKLNRSENY